jgi:membrane fusion protein, multidrug efflux system
VPTSAIQHSTANDFVFVIDKDNKAIVTKVVTGPLSGEDTVIQSGIQPGQRVVTGGSDKLKNGMQVVTSNAVEVAMFSFLYGLS